MNIPSKFALATLLAGFVTGISQSAHAQAVPCGDRERIIAHLADAYGERPTARGLDARGAVVEIISAPSGSWSMLLTTPGAHTCLVSSGIAWDSLKDLRPPDPGTGS